jgi:hypothetical protein
VPCSVRPWHVTPARAPGGERVGKRPHTSLPFGVDCGPRAAICPMRGGLRPAPTPPPPPCPLFPGGGAPRVMRPNHTRVGYFGDKWDAEPHLGPCRLCGYGLRRAPRALGYAPIPRAGNGNRPARQMRYGSTSCAVLSITWLLGGVWPLSGVCPSAPCRGGEVGLGLPPQPAACGQPACSWSLHAVVVCPLWARGAYRPP